MPSDSEKKITKTRDAVPDNKLEQLVQDVIGRVADKWTMVVIELLTEAGELRFSEIEDRVPGISQKMLSHCLRGMEREGLVTRTVYPEVPPRVHYKLTNLGLSLGAAFCGVWIWAEQNLAEIENARAVYDRQRKKK